VKLFHRCAAVLAAVTVVAGGTAFEAQAATSAKSASFGPTVITDVPKAPDATKHEKPTQKVVPLGTIETTIQAGTTAYVYSTVDAYDADDVNLIDNEVRCSGAGRSSVVMGENVFPRTSTSPLRKLTVVTRFLVTAESSGELICNQFLRTGSTSPNVSRETVKSELRFASEDVTGDVNGVALQRSLKEGTPPVTTSVAAPVLSGKIPAGPKQLAVIADVEFHRCSTTPKCTVKARFALTVTTSGGANCPSAPVAQIERTLQQGINHVAVPLYTKFPVKPGCTDFQAKVTTTHLAGDPGTIGGPATLPNGSGPINSTPAHESGMTHIFAVPS
jgi:hypothetical protein